MFIIEYVMLSLATIFLSGDFAINKEYQKMYGATLNASLVFNMMLGFFSAVIFTVLGGFESGFSVFSGLMAVISALLIMSYNFIGFKILKSTGKIAIYTMYLMTGGMLLPYIWGVIFMGEPTGFLRTAGLIMMICGIVISNFTFSEKKPDKKVLIMCIAVFVLNGIVSIVSKIHQTQTVYKCMNEFGFIALSGLAKFVLAGTLLCFLGKRATLCFFKPKTAGLTVLSAIFGGISYMFQLICAKTVSATLLYPFVTGGSIVLSAIMDLIIFKEKLSERTVIGIVLCFFGTIFLL